MNNTELFLGKAQAYAAARPGYAEEITSYILSLCGKAKVKIADIGAGTGILTKALLEKGAEVYAVEPNEDMRAVMLEELKSFRGFHAVAAPAEATTLDDKSIDLVTAATAFHWFDTEKFRGECRRILRPGRPVALLYNHQENTDFTRERHRILAAYCGHKDGFGKGLSTEEKIKAFFVKGYECKAAPNPQQYDEEGFVARCLSSSFALKPGDERFDDYVADLRRLFGKYAQNGLLTIAAATQAYVGCLD